jgi:hypothetical protein
MGKRELRKSDTDRNAPVIGVFDLVRLGAGRRSEKPHLSEVTIGEIAYGLPKFDS